MKCPLYASLLCFAAAMLVSDAEAAAPAPADGIRQPVFLLCPHRRKYSAWSVFLTVDRSDPTRVLALGLEKLTGKNSEDLAPNGYEAVLTAQQDQKTAREVLGTLRAQDFADSVLKIEQDDALHLSVSAVGSLSYRLALSLRVGGDDRFVIGGKAQAKRDVLLRFDRTTGKWGAYAVILEDAEGRKIVESGAKPISGLCFEVKPTGIFRIVGSVAGEAVVLMDR